jgi:hypothetical protein
MKLKYALIAGALVLLSFMIFFTLLILKPEWFPIFPLLPDKVIGVSTVLTAWTTLVLAFAAFWSIWQTKKIQEKQYKHALFKEIKGWAREVTALIDEHYRGVNTPDWHEHRAILRATKIGMKSQAKQISNDFEEKVGKAIKLFEAFDQDISNGIRSNNPKECKESCIKILESDPEKHV